MLNSLNLWKNIALIICLALLKRYYLHCSVEQKMSLKYLYINMPVQKTYLTLLGKMLDLPPGFLGKLESYYGSYKS